MKRRDDIQLQASTIPERVEITSIEPIVESIEGLVERRDHLRQMAKMALDEANRLDEEVKTTVQSHMRQLKSLAAAIDETPL